jgi:hypothetical protein
MNKNAIVVIQVLLVVAISSCNQRPATSDLKLYFDKYELAEGDWEDSLSNRYFSQQLSALNEPSLKDTSNANETLRLTVFPSIIYIPYCIKLEKTDSLYRVSFKVSSDDKAFRVSGLNGLSLTYQSNFESMDSIYREMKLDLDSLDIFSLNNLTPEVIKRNNIQGADGTTYLLEYYADRKHIALERWNGFLDERYYDRSDEFMKIINRLHNLVPSGVLPDLDAAHEPADLKFSVFKKKV